MAFANMIKQTTERNPGKKLQGLKIKIPGYPKLIIVLILAAENPPLSLYYGLPDFLL